MLSGVLLDDAFAEEEQDAAAELAIEMIGPNDQNFITSELVQYIFEESKGITLPRYAREQKGLGTEVERFSIFLERGRKESRIRPFTSAMITSSMPREKKEKRPFRI
ncbi:hypothetical protein ACFFH4_18985 [Halalkalibacter alkalisediminis]|uniref:Uncharacterized protein n=2 Tax=Halalkalibacter alkalisediminis TaxID=935616 RepID=A0ABV6NLN5_9BACI